MRAVPRVAVTGVGLTLPIGLSVGEVRERSRAGDSGIGPLRRFDAAGYAGRAAAEVPEFDLSASLRFPKNQKFMNTSVRCAMRAALEAVAASQVDLKRYDPFRIAVYTGSGQTGLEGAAFFDALDLVATGDEAQDFANLGGRASRLVDPYFSLRTLANAGVGLLSAECGARGPSGNFVQGDTASALAIASGYYDLVEGRADVALVGGYDSLFDVSTYLAYEKAGLLSPSAPDRAYRPFDRARDGIVPGEGAGFLVLERLDDVRGRGGPRAGEIVGVGSSMEALDTLEAKTSECALRSAIGAATGGQTCDFIVAHGIGTPAADRREADLLRAVAPQVPVTAFKGQTGYLGAATAAVEAVLALLAAEQREVPAIAGLVDCDSDLTLDFVVGRPRPLDRESPTALCLSWSWFGQCAALCVRARPS